MVDRSGREMEDSHVKRAEERAIFVGDFGRCGAVKGVYVCTAAIWRGDSVSLEHTMLL
jgi:hypothetical protein